MKPNIFDISTKELSQDAFITWLLQWADKSNLEIDSALSNCGMDFLTSIIKKGFPDFNEKIEKVRAGRQWKNIDVWVKINDKYLVLIEDKTYTGQHSGQLARYKKTVEKWCNEQTPIYQQPICIYLKTGNESQQSLNKVKEEGFKIYKRQEFIAILQNHELTNDIYNDFKSRLIKIERFNHEWENKLIKNWNGDDWQGFFQYLEKQMKIIGWNYVNNQSGGFWNAVLNWDYFDIYPFYFQTKEYKICFKISTDPAEPVVMPANVTRGEIRNRISNLILKTAKAQGIDTIRRPSRFGNGKYMTVAVIDSKNWLGNKDEKIDAEKVVERLLKYKKFLSEIIKNGY